MKSNFPIYYRYPERKIEEAVRNGMVFLDTNILLHLYRLGSSFQKTMFDIFDKLKDRILIPYHVAEEYHRRYYGVVVEEKQECRNLAKSIEQLVYPITDELIKKCRSLDDNTKREAKEAYDKGMEILKNHILAESKRLDVEMHDHKIHAAIAGFFEGRILQPFGNDVLAGLEEEGKERYAAKIPPGYMDGAKRDNKYCDLIIWREILEYAATDPERHIIFVSDDLKEDWRSKVRGEFHGPRLELIREFAERSNANLYLWSSSSFIHHVNNIYQVLSKGDADNVANAIQSYNEERIGIEKSVDASAGCSNALALDEEYDYEDDEFVEMVAKKSVKSNTANVSLTDYTQQNDF